MPLEEISCLLKKFLVTGGYFLTQDKFYCHRKKFPVIGRNLLSQQNNFPVSERNLVSQEKSFPFTGRNFLSKEEIFCQWMKFSVTEKNFLSQDKIFRKKYFSCEIKLIFFPVKQFVLTVRGFVPPLVIFLHLLCTNSIFLSQLYFF